MKLGGSGEGGSKSGNARFGANHMTVTFGRMAIGCLLAILGGCLMPGSKHFGIDLRNEAIPEELRILAQRSSQGDPDAALQLGIKYYEADGLNLDMPLAESLFGISAKGNGLTADISKSYLGKLKTQPKLYIRSHYRNMTLFQSNSNKIDPCLYIATYFYKYISNIKNANCTFQQYQDSAGKRYFIIQKYENPSNDFSKIIDYLYVLRSNPACGNFAVTEFGGAEPEPLLVVTGLRSDYPMYNGDGIVRHSTNCSGSER